MARIKLPSNVTRKVVALFFGFISFVASAQIDSLYKSSDFVLVGQIKIISGWFSGDLGTDHFYVTLDVDTIYKQGFVPQTQPIQLHWIVSNLRCPDVPSNSCISKHEGEPKVFFLKREHFFEGAEIPDELILPATKISRRHLNQLKTEDLIVVEPFSSPNVCNDNCELCSNVESEQWDKVEKHIKKHANAEWSNNWMHHQAVQWVLPDRMILASLPSSMSMRFNFITNTGNVEALVHYQVGYYKTYFTWIPRLLNALFNAQAYGRFSRENYDTLILKSFELDKVTSTQYLAHEEREYKRQVRDSSWTAEYGNSIPLDSTLVLLASAYEGPTKLYVDYKTMPDYEGRAKAYVDTLLKYKKVYSLCLMTNHGHPEIAAYSVSALEKLADVKAIPWLVDLASFEISAGFYPKHYEKRNVLRKQLIETIDELTSTQTLSRSYPYGMPEHTFEMSFSIPLWRSKYVFLE